MKRACFLLGFFLASAVLPAASPNSPFAIRGLLPWHNFLSGPTAWDEEDYVKYLDQMKAQGLNYIAFHCYTGGAERYSPYVEPFIRIQYRDVLPEAALDTSLTARWGYRPLAVSNFVFDTAKLFKLPPGAAAFGSRCAVLPRTNAERYEQAQALMRKVIALAHERGIKVAIGFEFGIHPPELASITPPGTFIRGTQSPDPTHSANIEILRIALDDIIRAYPDIDWIWLWLHEFSMNVGNPMIGPSFQKVIQQNIEHFKDAKNDYVAFTGLWALAYIRQAYDYLKLKAPRVRLAISGWGGSGQLPLTLRGLDRALPKDIVFSCLNPGQGTQPQPSDMAEIAKNREVWAIPWLEGDLHLWHLQPRVSLLRQQLRLAQEQKLNGVLAIHWRTEDIQPNMVAFAEFARNPNAAPTVEEFYLRYCEQQFGKTAAAVVAPWLSAMDKDQKFSAVISPEYYPYDPSWGRMPLDLWVQLNDFASRLRTLMEQTADPAHKANLDWLLANLEFAMQLDEVSRSLEEAYHLKDRWLRGEVTNTDLSAEIATARESLKKAPLEKLFRTYSRRVRSKGELGVLSALNQKLWLTYRELARFLDELKPEPKNP